LRYAQSKLSANAKTIHADCAHLNLDPCSADLILCNFLLSYLPDPASFLKATKSLLRPGASLFVTDLHPETSANLHWRRGPKTHNEFQEIQTSAHSVAEIVGACHEVNLRMSAFLLPRFGEEERAIFERNNKGDYFEAIRELPPIYILQFTAPTSPLSPRISRDAANLPILLCGARAALSGSMAHPANVRIAGRFVEAVVDHEPPPYGTLAYSEGDDVDLTGYLLLPGLINAHDHLEFALFPRLGNGAYNNFLEWVDDIYYPSASPIAEHRQVPRHVRLWWGGIRNLLCGVTTVCHHNPYEPGVFTEDFPVRVLRDYGWAHSLALDSDVAQKKRATPEEQPFFVHLAEGIDVASSHEIFSLHRAGALDSNTVIIHGLGMDSKGRALFGSLHAGLIWCPTSNIFLFGKTFSTAELRRFPRVALGSDSPLTAAGDLLDEVNCARRLLSASPDDLYRYVTGQAANILCLQNGEGNLRIGTVADIVAVRDTGLTPAETLVNLSYREIELVLLAGRVQLASPEMKNRLPARHCEGLQPLSVDGITRWVRAPLGALFAQTRPHLGDNLRLSGRVVQLGN
jgi:cytosine/adenosine deaminase-related metal-dependent hydrolase